MVKDNYSDIERTGLVDVVNCVKEHLERAGFNVTTSHQNSIGTAITAKKDIETYIVEAIGEKEKDSSPAQEQELLCAIGEIVRRMKKQEIRTVYGIAMPESYFKLLKDFEVGGIQLLDFQIFFVENFWSLYHLDSKTTIELIQDLKTDVPKRLIDLDIDFKRYDYNI